MEDIEKFIEIGRKYSDFEQEVRKYRYQIFDILHNNRIIPKSAKSCVSEELDKLEEMENRLNILRKQYNEILDILFNKNN